MHEILRERVWRRLQALPQEQLYQVLDYVEFLEARYAREQAVKADPIQKFAERLEDGMRMRSVAPKLITGTVGLLGSARRVLRTVSDAGREMLGDTPDTSARPPADRPSPQRDRPVVRDPRPPAPAAPPAATHSAAVPSAAAPSAAAPSVAAPSPVPPQDRPPGTAAGPLPSGLPHAAPPPAPNGAAEPTAADDPGSP
jgi:hypothetical protein